MHDFLRRSLLASATLLTVTLTATACGDSGTAGNSDPLTRRGAQLFTQLGCNSCHSTRGQRLVGPPLNRLYGKPVQLDDGRTVTADEAYLRESILDPDAKTVAGYSKGVMAIAIADKLDQIKKDDNIDALIAYIKSLQ